MLDVPWTQGTGDAPRLSRAHRARPEGRGVRIRQGPESDEDDWQLLAARDDGVRLRAAGDAAAAAGIADEQRGVFAHGVPAGEQPGGADDHDARLGFADAGEDAVRRQVRSGQPARRKGSEVAAHRRPSRPEQESPQEERMAHPASQATSNVVEGSTKLPPWAMLGALFGVVSAFSILTFGPIGVSGTYPRFVGAVMRRVDPAWATANPYLEKMGSFIKPETFIVLGLLIGGFLASRIGKQVAARTEFIHTGETTKAKRNRDAFLGGFL